MRSLKILTASFAVLALASCGGGGTTGEAPKGEAVAAVAPPAGKQWIDVVSKTAEGGYLIGNPDAPVKLMEFASLTCHVCAQFSKDSGSDFHDNFINNGKVSYEFRNFVRDELDLMAARIAQCGANEAMLPLTEQFMAFQETLFQNAEKMSANKALEAQLAGLKNGDRFFAIADASGIVEFFAQRGVSRDQSRACLSDTPAMQKLADQTAEYGKKYSVQGTPTFYLNGVKLDVTAWAQVKGKLQEAGAR
jgi:protein-disulfide isomerase